MTLRRILQFVSLVVVFSSLVFWFFSGANRGWTKTSVPKKTLDEVTGIEGITYEKSFRPGLDFLGATLLGGGTLAGASLALRKQTTPTHPA